MNLRAIGLGLMATMAAGGAEAGLDSCPAPAPATEMTLTFESNFAETGKIDPAQWRRYVGQHGVPSHEKQVYLPDEMSVEPGYGLRITTSRRDYWEHQYSSGQLMTQGIFAQTYGHFEILAKLPQANGLWPAFWLMPESGDWPPEIDVYEYIFAPFGNTANGAAYAQSTFHWKGPRGEHRSSGQADNSDIPRFLTGNGWDSTAAAPGIAGPGPGFHLYSVDWRPGSLLFQIDRNTVFCVKESPGSDVKVPAWPMYMVVNTAISGGTKVKPGWPGHLDDDQAFPLSHDIAYVRAYQFKDQTAAPVLPFDIRGVRLSNPTPRPGETVTITADIKVGPAALGKGNVTFGLFSYINPGEFHGRKNDIAKVSIAVPALEAGKTKTVKGSFVVPADAAPDYYGLWLWATYTDGPVNGDTGGKRLFYSPLAQYIKVM